MSFEDSSLSIGDDEAIFYEHSDFSGESLSMHVGEEDNLADWGGRWNDRISSFRLGKYVRVQFCIHDDCSDHDGKPGYIDFVGPLQYYSS